MLDVGYDRSTEGLDGGKWNLRPTFLQTGPLSWEPMHGVLIVEHGACISGVRWWDWHGVLLAFIIGVWEVAIPIEEQWADKKGLCKTPALWNYA